MNLRQTIAGTLGFAVLVLVITACASVQRTAAPRSASNAPVAAATLGPATHPPASPNQTLEASLNPRQTTSPSVSLHASAPPSPRGEVDIPPANATVTTVHLHLGVGPEKMHLIIADQSGALVKARYATETEWRRATDLPGWPDWNVRAVASDPKTVLVSIAGQVCDEIARVVVGPDEQRIEVYDGPHPGCDAMGIDWLAALTFRNAVPLRTIQLVDEGWPFEDATVVDLPALAQRITRSLGSTVVLSSEVIGHDDGRDIVKVVLGGRYHFCNGSECHQNIGHETLVLTTDWPQLNDYQVAEGLP